jgi:hypothetical protein
VSNPYVHGDAAHDGEPPTGSPAAAEPAAGPAAPGSPPDPPAPVPPVFPAASASAPTPAPPGAPPGAFPGAPESTSPPAPPAPPPGSFPGAPPPGSPPAYGGSGGLPPYGTPPTAPKKRRGPLVAIAVGAVAVVGAGAFALTQLGGSGGAGSPEAAAEQMFDAIADEDVIGVLEALPPGERDAIQPSVEDLAAELERLGILAEDTTLDGLSGVDIEFEGLEFEVEELADGVAAVEVTAGTVTGAATPDQLPIGDTLSGLLDENDIDVSGEQSTEESDLAESDLRLVTIDDGDGWHVSLFYSIAEAARVEAGAPVPAFGQGVEPEGGESPEGAVEGLFDALSDLDAERAIAMLPPDEMAALYDYAPLFLDDADAAAAETREDLTITFDDLQFETEDAGDGATRVTMAGFQVGVSSSDGEFSASYDGECATFEGDFDDADLEDLVGDDGQMCTEDMQELGLLGSSAGFHGGFITVEWDGRHFVSPTRTIFDGVIGFLQVLEADQIDTTDELEELFLGDLAGLAEEEDFGSEPPPDEEVLVPEDPIAPEGLGDNPEFQALADSCFAGDMAACDNLFLTTPAGDPYETYAKSCGGRRDPELAVGGTCVADFGAFVEPGVPATPGEGEGGGGDAPPVPGPAAPPVTADNPDLQPLVDACYAGDMQACDDLYFESDIDSIEEGYGYTCAGRRPENQSSETCVGDYGEFIPAG